MLPSIVVVSFPLISFRADIGQPQDFLNGMKLYLQSLANDHVLITNADNVQQHNGDRHNVERRRRQLIHRPVIVSKNTTCETVIPFKNHQDEGSASSKNVSDDSEGSPEGNCSKQVTTQLENKNELTETQPEKQLVPAENNAMENLRLSCGDEIIGNVLIDPTAQIGRGCLIGPNVTIGSGCVIHEGCRISNSAIMERVTIRAHSCLQGSIVGWESKIGKWVGWSAQ